MVDLLFLFFFFFNDPATTEIYTLSLHDALPIHPTEQLLRVRKTGARLEAELRRTPTQARWRRTTELKRGELDGGTNPADRVGGDRLDLPSSCRGMDHQARRGGRHGRS